MAIAILQKKETLNEVFNLDVPIDVQAALDLLLKLDGRKAGMTTFARELLQKYVPIEDVGGFPESSVLSIRMTTALKAAMVAEAGNHEMTPSEYGRRVLAHGVNREFASRAKAHRVDRWTLPLVLRSSVLALLVLAFAILFMRPWDGEPKNDASVSGEGSFPIINLRSAETPGEGVDAALVYFDERLYEAFLQRGFYFYDQGQYGRALQDLRHARTLKETEQVNQQLAKTYQKLGNEDKAREYLKKRMRDNE